MGDSDRTVFVGNLSDKITESLVYELFLQAGPIINVRIPTDKKTKKLKNFGFVEFKDECSVPFAVYLLDKIKLFGRNITVQTQNKLPLPPIDCVGIHSLDPEKKSVNNSAATSLLGEPNQCNLFQTPRPLNTSSQGFNIDQQTIYNPNQGYNKQGPFISNPQLANQQGWHNQPSLFDQHWFSLPGQFNQQGPFHQQDPIQQQRGFIDSCYNPQFDARLIIDTANLNNFKNHYDCNNYPQSQNDRHRSRHDYNQSNHHRQGAQQDYHRYNSYQSNIRENWKNNRRY